jgi:hypothetical protein
MSDSRDVGDEEVDALAVEVASGSVIVLCGSGVGVPGQDPGISKCDPCVEGVGDGCVA